MANKTCSECGQPECACFSICPTQDPYQGDQAAEEADYSFNARYDRFDGYDRGDLDYVDDPGVDPGIDSLSCCFQSVANHLVREAKHAADTAADAAKRAAYLAEHGHEDNIPF